MLPLTVTLAIQNIECIAQRVRETERVPSVLCSEIYVIDHDPRLFLLILKNVVPKTDRFKSRTLMHACVYMLEYFPFFETL